MSTDALTALLEQIKALELKRGINEELTSSGYIYKRFGFNECRKLVVEKLDAVLASLRQPQPERQVIAHDRPRNEHSDARSADTAGGVTHPPTNTSPVRQPQPETPPQLDDADLDDLRWAVNLAFANSPITRERLLPKLSASLRADPPQPETPQSYAEKVHRALDYVRHIVVESDGYPMEHSANDIRTLLVNAFITGLDAASLRADPPQPPLGTKK